MENWKFRQYNNVVDSFLANCNPDEEVELKAKLGILLEKGNRCVWPVSKPLGNGLFSLRAKEKRKHMRLLYIFMPQRIICFVHAFIKKTRQISLKDIRIARENIKKVENERRGQNE